MSLRLSLSTTSRRALPRLPVHLVTNTQSRCLASVSTPQPEKKYKVVVVGGGSAGLAVTAQLSADPAFRSTRDILLIDPAQNHYYQPLWTLVGAGIKSFSESAAPLASLVPQQAQHLKDRVSRIDPNANIVVTKSNQTISYDYLVIASGIQINYDKINGLKEALAASEVSKVASIYDEQSVQSTASLLKGFKGGNAIFTQPSTPIKCAGAPQKIAYLAEEIFSENSVRANTNVQFHTGMGKIFAIDKYAAELRKVCDSRNININLFSDLKEIKIDQKQAIFVHPTDSNVSEKVVSYDLLHVVPPMGPPSYIKESKISDAAGWVDVNKDTTQHNTYKNIFALGDSSSLPTSKTAAAAAAQSKVTTQNLLSAMKNQPLAQIYSGYTSCPLFTGKNKLILAEFSGYTSKPHETFAFDQSKETAFAYQLTAQLIPQIYWNGQVKGLWSGPEAYRRITNPFNSS